MLATLIILFVTFAINNHVWDKIFQKPEATKTHTVKISKSLEEDKKNVLNKTTNEFFKNYLETIRSLRLTYAPVSALGHIQDYLRQENLNVEFRIANKSYVHRFAVYEKFWTKDDFIEIASLIRARTINRSKEITEDVENKAQGAFMLSDNKLQILEDEVQSELPQK